MTEPDDWIGCSDLWLDDERSDHSGSLCCKSVCAGHPPCEKDSGSDDQLEQAGSDDAASRKQYLSNRLTDDNHDDPYPNSLVSKVSLCCRVSL